MRLTVFIFEANTEEIASGIAGGVALVLIVVLLIVYRNWRYEQELVRDSSTISILKNHNSYTLYELDYHKRIRSYGKSITKIFKFPIYRSVRQDKAKLPGYSILSTYINKRQRISQLVVTPSD